MNRDGMCVDVAKRGVPDMSVCKCADDRCPLPLLGHTHDRRQ